MISTEQAQTLLDGGNVLGHDDEKIGKVGQVYLDDQTGQPEWVTAKTGLFGSSESFVPLAHAEARGNDVVVPYDKAKVKDAPRVDTDGSLSQEQEAELYDFYDFYGFTYTENQSDSGLPASGQQHTGTSDRDADSRDTSDHNAGVHDTSGPTTDDAMTRSEERLEVGTERRESGRARLRKYVVTENVTQTVPVSREEVRVEREPITDANRDQAMGGGEITEEEHEVALHEERPVVAKSTVPVERVRMDTEAVTGEEQVTEEVRKEQIDTDGVDQQRTR